jgi:hypothetical protein
MSEVMVTEKWVKCECGRTVIGIECDELKELLQAREAERQAARETHNLFKGLTLYAHHNPPSYNWKIDGVDVMATDWKDNTMKTMSRIGDLVRAYNDAQKRVDELESQG